jgi:hypothetical protein
MLSRLLLFMLLSIIVSSCGLTEARLPEVWDASKPNAVFDMEAQIKQAIYCQLIYAAHDVQGLPWLGREQNTGQDIATGEDQYLPDSWGVLVQLTIQAEEKSSATPNVTFKTPMHNVPVNFGGETIGATGALAAITYGPLSVAQSFGLGVGGQLSSDNTRSDKYNVYYSAKQLNFAAQQLNKPPTNSGPCRQGYLPGAAIGSDQKSSSSPFLNADNLGIREWLQTAVQVINWERTSRVDESGEGPPIVLQAGGSATDSSTYDNKFIIVTDANIAPNWNLVRIGTPATPMFDAMRTRTHELIMTIGPGANSFKTDKKTGKTVLTVEPSGGASSAFLATQIGAAVANALRSQ